MNNKLKRSIFIICLVVFIGCLFGAGYVLFRVSEENRVSGGVAGMVNTNTPMPTPAEPTVTAAPQVLEKYAALYAENPDIIGWLRIPDSTIDLPVMQTPEEPDKYLHLDFYGDYSNNGTLYADARCDIWESDNILIYGHHMLSGAMFGNLMAYANESYWENHKTLEFDTIYEESSYEIVAACYARLLSKSEEGFRYYYFFGSESEEEFNEYRDFIEENRRYDTGVDIEYGDKLVTLSTCAYQVEDGRFFVVARRIGDGLSGAEEADPAANQAIIEDEPPAHAAAPAALSAQSKTGARAGRGMSSDLILLSMGLVFAGTGILALGRRRQGDRR